MPKLRFPEFRGAEGWKITRLGDVGSVRMCKRIFKEQTSPRGDIPFYKIGTFGGIPDAYISQDLFESYKKKFPFPRNGAVLISAAGTIGRMVRYKDELAYFQDSNIVWLDNSEKLIADAFLFYLYQLINWSPSVGTIQRLYNENILGTEVRFPSLPEQQKIAECLSSVDELMAAQARKVDALKTHKKGLMQQLFPREGETQPRLRFPEFQNAGEWGTAPLGKLLMGSPDYGVNAAAVPFSEQLPKYLRITDISEDGRYLPDKQVSVDLDTTDGNYLDEGDIVLARTGASVGKSYQYRKEDGRLVFAGFLIRVKPHPKKLVSTYLANFLTTGQFWKWVAVTSARSGQPGINSTEYSSLTIPLPPTIPEQQRIALCLSSLDALITAETQKLEALKTHKKGLMQQLFPSPEEVAV
jgi:type I restriction enzyme S subunit